MHIAAGTILISTPLLDHSIFEKTIVYISEYNVDGTSGFIVNKLFPKRLNDLIEFRNSPSVHLYAGGPVEMEKLYFVHQRPDLIEGGIFVCNSIYLGGNFKQATDSINKKALLENDIKLFIGYCGWDFGQLDAEIAEGCWLPIEMDVPETVFRRDNRLLWKELYARWAN
ncbi:YqgE/AlgH family protein [Arachidicoccus sp.]|jgi:putative transcriptional regulator|uniref:YqgE/AlgH family protein n=1 Tax=Arachidicoccus sp. TaxID=1872624 RepID=UPI003D1C6EEA